MSQGKKRRCSAGGQWRPVHEGQRKFQCRCGASLIVRPVDLDPRIGGKVSPQWFALIPVHAPGDDYAEVPRG